MDQTTPAHQIVFRHHRERCKNTNMDRCFSLRAGCDHQEATSSGCQPLHNFTDFERDHFEKMPLNQVFSGSSYKMKQIEPLNQLILFD